MSDRKMSKAQGVGSKFKDTVTSMLPQMSKRSLQDKYFFAVYTQNIPEIIRCLHKGVNPNVWHPEYGVSALHLIAERDDYVLGYRILQMKGLNLELKTDHGETPLHLAALSNCKRFADLLLQHGHSPDATNRHGKTPLHYAVERECYGIVVKLLKHGASVNVLDCFQNTPLSMSILDVENLLIAKTLLQYGVDFRLELKRPLHIFFETVLNCRSVTQIEFVVLLLDNGVDINMREKVTDRNCLHFVAITGFMELAVVLVEKGADLDSSDITRRTPSRVAVENGNEILADYFRKGYRPPHMLHAMPLLHLWTNKLKAKLEEQRRENPEGGSESRERRKIT